MGKNKLQDYKKIHMSILFFLYMLFIIFLFYLAYQFINNQHNYKPTYIIIPIVLVSASIIPLSQIISINKKNKK